MPSTLELSELTTRIGRVFMAGMPGFHMDQGTERLIRDYGLGGIILFSRNIEDPVQVAALCRELQKTALRSQGTPLFIAVDQEGGRVARLKKPFTEFPGNEFIGRDPRPVDRAKEFAEKTAEEMSLVGINMNLAPVLDIRSEPVEKHLSGRTFSDDPEKVALLGKTVIRTFQEKGVMAVAKHFPGLGKTTLDPHLELPVIRTEPGIMDRANLVPFRTAVKADVSAVMTAHAVYPELDPDHPATISEKIIGRLLRETMGYQGLVITDDLEMGAIAKNVGPIEGAAASFKAGADILLICENQDTVLEAVENLRRRLLRGEIPLQRLEQSLDRLHRARSTFLLKAEGKPLDEVRAYFSRADT